MNVITPYFWAWGISEMIASFSVGHAIDWCKKPAILLLIAKTEDPHRPLCFTAFAAIAIDLFKPYWLWTLYTGAYILPLFLSFYRVITILPVWFFSCIKRQASTVSSNVKIRLIKGRSCAREIARFMSSKSSREPTLIGISTAPLA